MTWKRPRRMSMIDQPCSGDPFASAGQPRATVTSHPIPRAVVLTSKAVPLRSSRIILFHGRGRSTPIALLPRILVRGALLLVLLSPPGRAATPDIVLPWPVAITLPAGADGVGIDDPPMRDLIGKVRAGEDKVTVTLPQDRIRRGRLARDLVRLGPGITGTPAARRDSTLFVLPHGMEVVGASGGGNALAGNNTPHVARDAWGSLHMVWYHSWAGMGDGAQYRRVTSSRTGRSSLRPRSCRSGRIPAPGRDAHRGDVRQRRAFRLEAEGTLRYRSFDP